jgi:hypothetical protein
MKIKYKEQQRRDGVLNQSIHRMTLTCPSYIVDKYSSQSILHIRLTCPSYIVDKYSSQSILLMRLTCPSYIVDKVLLSINPSHDTYLCVSQTISSSSTTEVTRGAAEER